MWVEEIKNGKYKMVERYEDYLTGQIRRVSVTMDRNTPQSRKTAQKALDEKIDKALSKSAEKNVTLRQLVEEYRKDQQHSVKKSTYTRNYHACNTIMGILGESTIVERMTAKYVHDKFLATGKPAGTLNEHLARFRALIRWGYHNDLLQAAAFLDKIEPFKDVPHKAKIQDKYLEADELKALLAGMQDSTWRLLTEFLALSGLRFGEAAALLNEDVDLSNNAIHITKTYDSVNAEVTTAKSICSIRDVFTQEELKAVCRQINAQMLRRRLMYGIKDSSLFMFANDGGHIHYFTYNKYLKENSERLVGKKITAHTLRHTHASLLMEQGIGIDTISRRLGHEGSRITKEIYLHVTEKLKEKDNAQISAVKIL